MYIFPMHREIEAKFLNIDKDNIIKKLQNIGAIKIFDEKILRRCVYNLLINKKGAWARIRDEGDKITMTYKRILDNKLDGVEEIEITVSSFEKGREFLKSIGLVEKAYQETKRIRYITEDENIEFDIDTWPGLKPWIEIEANSKELVKKYAKLLGFDWSEAKFGSADIIYELTYKIDKEWINNKCPNLVFNNIPKKLQPENLR